MGKIVKVEKKMLKISVKEYEKKLKKDKITARLLKEQDQETKKALKKLKEKK